MKSQYDVYMCRERANEFTERERQLLNNFFEEKLVRFSAKDRHAKMTGATVVNSWLSYTIVGVK